MKTPISPDKLSGLPGEEMVRKGLTDLGSGKITEEACLVSMASPRLRDCGLLSVDTSLVADAETTLYRLLGQRAEDPYASYNNLVRRLVSFERALDTLAAT